MFGFFRVILVIAIVLPLSAFAGRVEKSIITQLQEQGFTQIQINRTWLGRSRIVAKSRNYTREIVVNPATGAILRDYWKDVDDVGPAGPARGLLNPEAIAKSGINEGGKDIADRNDGDRGNGAVESASNDSSGNVGAGAAIENARGASAPSDGATGDAGTDGDSE